MQQPTHALVLITFPPPPDIRGAPIAADDLQKFEQSVSANVSGRLQYERINACTYLLELENGLQFLIAISAALSELPGSSAQVMFCDQVPKFVPL